MVSMTPFGQTGPYSRLQGHPDLVGMAMGGLTYLTGDADRPPLRVSQPQFSALTGASGAIGAMVAHYHRLKTGVGTARRCLGAAGGGEGAFGGSRHLGPEPGQHRSSGGASGVWVATANYAQPGNAGMGSFPSLWRAGVIGDQCQRAVSAGWPRRASSPFPEAQHRLDEDHA